MPLVVPTFTFSDTPKLTAQQMATLKGKIMLYDDSDEIGQLGRQAVRLSKIANEKYEVQPAEYFYKSQLPDNVVVVDNDIGPTARLGIARSGMRGIIVDEFGMVTGFL